MVPLVMSLPHPQPSSKDSSLAHDTVVAVAGASLAAVPLAMLGKLKISNLQQQVNDLQTFAKKQEENYNRNYELEHSSIDKRFEIFAGHLAPEASRRAVERLLLRPELQHCVEHELGLPINSLLPLSEDWVEEMEFHASPALDWNRAISECRGTNGWTSTLMFPFGLFKDVYYRRRDSPATAAAVTDVAPRQPSSPSPFAKMAPISHWFSHQVKAGERIATGLRMTNLVKHAEQGEMRLLVPE
ncbi:MAG: hypothetical protein M1826_004418 [Phylliscum demangeonii]|nr:MAG: hypothetical protein M1826_004418 [Phylliscum demangeonii]